MQKRGAIDDPNRPPICLDAIISTIQEMRDNGDDPNPPDAECKVYDVTVHPAEFCSGLHRETKWWPLLKPINGLEGYYHDWGDIRINVLLSLDDPNAIQQSTKRQNLERALELAKRKGPSYTLGELQSDL